MDLKSFKLKIYWIEKIWIENVLNCKLIRLAIHWIEKSLDWKSIDWKFIGLEIYWLESLLHWKFIGLKYKWIENFWIENWWVENLLDRKLIGIGFLNSWISKSASRFQRRKPRIYFPSTLTVQCASPWQQSGFRMII